MVTKMEDDTPFTVVLADKALGSAPHLRCAHISPAGETGHVKRGGDLLNNANEGIFFHPHLNIIGLVLAGVDDIGVKGGAHDAGRGAPMGVLADVAGAVLNGRPVNEACQAGVIDEVACIFIAPLIVGDVVPGHKLVIDLSERQVIALGRVLLNNRVDDGNEAETVRSEIDFLICVFGHFVRLLGVNLF